MVSGVARTRGRGLWYGQKHTIRCRGGHDLVLTVHDTARSAALVGVDCQKSSGSDPIPGGQVAITGMQNRINRGRHRSPPKGCWIRAGTRTKGL